jgi:CheY-like chemotaxis protein
MTLRLLVADDSATIQKIVKLAFFAEDAVVQTADSGDAAMDLVKEFRPDVVLADVFMPGFGGYEVCERIKKDPEFSDTPVLLLVGAFEPFDESEASRVRCDGHLTKPFDTSEMIETVRSLVGDKMIPQNGENPDYSQAGEPASAAPSNPDPACTSAKGFTNSRVWESYLGDSCVLEILDPKTREAGHTLALLKNNPTIEDGTLSVSAGISEKLLNSIVDRVVRRISPDVIREVAWEVVPELSEILIRRVLEEPKQS